MACLDGRTGQVTKTGRVMSRLSPMIRITLPLLMALASSKVHSTSLCYDFEGERGTLATDEPTAEDAQNGNVLGNVSLQTAPPRIVPCGTQSVLFAPPSPNSPPPFSTIEIAETTLGTDFMPVQTTASIWTRC